jgi:putative salt-induced outer membrane protein YdiY
MRLRLCHCLPLVLLAAVSAQAEGDVVTLKNGDRLSGTIVKMTDEKLVITTPYAKEIPVAWAEVASLETATPHVVRLKPDDFVTARFTKRADGMYLESPDLQSARPIALDQIATIDVPPGPAWSGNIAAYFNGDDGNTNRTGLGGVAELIRRTDDDRFRVGGRIEYAEERDADTGENDVTARNSMGWANYDYFLGPHWTIGGFGRLEYDRLEDLTLRTTIGAGPGYRFVDTKKMLFRTYLGPAYINENYNQDANPDTEDREFIALALGDEFRWWFTEGAHVYQLLDVYPNLEDTSDVLINAAAGIRYTVVKGLFVDVGIADEYDTEPAEGKEKNDFHYRLAFGYAFGG